MPTVSIIIRSYNDMPLIAATLAALARQSYRDFELICADCSSSDGTAEELRRHNPAVFLNIDSGDYVPGRVLNRAVRACSGRIVVFNNSDSIPVGDDWLGNLVRPLLAGAADAVFANQRPRPDAWPLVRKDHQRAFGDGHIAAGWNHFFSLASAACGRELLLRFPFNGELRYSEDVEWSLRLKNSGFRIAYAADAVVEHSHNYTAAGLRKRFYNEGVAEYAIHGWRGSLLTGFLRPWLTEAARDLFYLLRSGEYGAIPGGLAWRFRQKYSVWRGRCDAAGKGGQAGPPMSVANIVRRFSFAEWGGTETVVWNTAGEMRGQGVGVRILATEALDSCREECRDGIMIRRFPYFYPLFPLSPENRVRLDKKGGNPLSFSLWRYLRKEKFDLLHCHVMGRMGAVVRRAAARRGIPYVISLHGGCYDVPVAEVAAMCEPMRQSLNYGRIIDLPLGLNGDCVAGADGIICVGYNEYELVRKRFPGKLAAYIPNGVDVDKFRRPSTADFRALHGIAPDEKMILCVSRIDYQKNQLLLLRALVLLREKFGESPRLVLIGPVTADRYHQELCRFAADNGLGDRLTIIGGMHPDDPGLPAAYRAADVFVLPSRHEPFGIVVLEAWAAGTPVLAAEVGGLKKLIVPDENGLFFEPDDPAGLARLLRRLDLENGLAERLSAAGSAVVSSDYSWERVTARLMEFYEEVRDEYRRRL